MNGSNVKKAERDVRQSTQHFEHAMDRLEETIDDKTRGFRSAVEGFNRRRSAVRSFGVNARTRLSPHYSRARDSFRENPTPFVLSTLTILMGGVVWALAMRREEGDFIEVDTLEGLNEPLSQPEFELESEEPLRASE